MNKKLLKKHTILLFITYGIVYFIGIFTLYSAFQELFENSLKTSLLTKRKTLIYLNENNVSLKQIKDILGFKEVHLFDSDEAFSNKLKTLELYGKTSENLIFDKKNSFVYFILKMGGLKNKNIFMGKIDFEKEKREFNNYFYCFAIIITLTILLLFGFSFISSKKRLCELSEIVEGLKKLLEEENFSLERNPFYPLFENVFGKLKSISLNHKEIYNQYSLLKEIVRNLDDLVIVIDDKEIITFANENLKNLSNIEASGKKYWEVFVEKELLDFIEKEENFNGKIEIKHRIFRIKKMSFNGFRIVIMKDISELEKMEENKMRFISLISHEIRTPITVIKGYIETILEEKTLKNAKYYASICLKNIDRITHLISELSNIFIFASPYKKLKKEIFNLSDLVREIIEFYSLELKKTGNKITFNSYEEITISADKERLFQLFTNLIDNSLKFTTNGIINIKMKKENAFVSIEFSDTGRGIEEDKLPYIFEEFYTTDEKGFGLGLAIVKKIVLLHGGKISVESKLNKGTCFRIILPQK